MLAKSEKEAGTILRDLESVVKSDDVVTDMLLTYMVEERILELLTEIGPVTEKMLSDMRYSFEGWGIFEEIFLRTYRLQ